MKPIASLVTSFVVIGILVCPVAAQQPVRKTASATADAPRWNAFAPKTGIVLRQDLFDRANPTNVKTDWPAPPAQPGQY